MDTLKSYFNRMKILPSSSTSPRPGLVKKLTRKGSLGNKGTPEKKRGKSESNGVCVTVGESDTEPRRSRDSMKSPPAKPPRRDQIFSVQFNKIEDEELGVGIDAGSEINNGKSILTIKKIVYISEIALAGRDGRLRVGDEIIDINGHPLHHETVASSR